MSWLQALRVLLTTFGVGFYASFSEPTRPEPIDNFVKLVRQQVKDMFENINVPVTKLPTPSLSHLITEYMPFLQNLEPIEQNHYSLEGRVVCGSSVSNSYFKELHGQKREYVSYSTGRMKKEGLVFDTRTKWLFQKNKSLHPDHSFT